MPELPPLVVALVTEADPEYLARPDGRRGHCSKCGGEVLLSPAGGDAVEAGLVRLLCWGCARELQVIGTAAGLNYVPVLLPPTVEEMAAQLQQLKDRLRRN